MGVGGTEVDADGLSGCRAYVLGCNGRNYLGEEEAVEGTIDGTVAVVLHSSLAEGGEIVEADVTHSLAVGKTEAEHVVLSAYGGIDHLGGRAALEDTVAVTLEKLRDGDATYTTRVVDHYQPTVFLLLVYGNLEERRLIVVLVQHLIVAVRHDADDSRDGLVIVVIVILMQDVVA